MSNVKIKSPAVNEGNAQTLVLFANILKNCSFDVGLIARIIQYFA